MPSHDDNLSPFMKLSAELRYSDQWGGPELVTFVDIPGQPPLQLSRRVAKQSLFEMFEVIWENMGAQFRKHFADIQEEEERREEFRAMSSDEKMAFMYKLILERRKP